MQKCIFLDRDGTLNVDNGYTYDKKDFKWEMNAIIGLEKLKKIGYKLIVITNQAGVAKGLYSEQKIDILHQFMNKELLNYNIKIDGFYYCPHHIEGVINKYKKKCDYRKPGTKMFEKAQEDFNIDYKTSYMVGDKITDLIPAIKLGIKPIFVKTGHGKEEVEKMDSDFKKNIEIFENFYEFANSLKK